MSSTSNGEDDGSNLLNRSRPSLSVDEQADQGGNMGGEGKLSVMSITSSGDDGCKRIKRNRSSLSVDEEADQEDNKGGNRILKKGTWTLPEDSILVDYVKEYGERNWNAVQKRLGLSRCGKSCRLRWKNHLRPDLKKGAFTEEEERRIIDLHIKFGNKWALMAAELPGRTDNEIKNYWNTRLKRRAKDGLPIYPDEIFQRVNNGNGENLNMLTNEASQQYYVSQKDKSINDLLPKIFESLNPKNLKHCKDMLDIGMAELSPDLSLNPHMDPSMLPSKLPWDSDMIYGGISGGVHPRVSCPYDPDPNPRSSSLFDQNIYPSLSSSCNPDTYLGVSSLCDLDSYPVSYFLCNPETYNVLSSLCDAKNYPRLFSPCDPILNTGDQFHGDNLMGNHATSNGNNSFSEPISGAMRFELPSLQYLETQQGSWGMSTSPQLPPLESFDTLIQCPPTELNPSVLVSLESPPLPPLESTDTLIKCPPTELNRLVFVSPESPPLPSFESHDMLIQCPPDGLNQSVLVSPKSPPLPPLEHVDTLIQCPPTELNPSVLVSPESSGLLESTLYNSKSSNVDSLQEKFDYFVPNEANNSMDGSHPFETTRDLYINHEEFIPFPDYPSFEEILNQTMQPDAMLDNFGLYWNDQPLPEDPLSTILGGGCND